MYSLVRPWFYLLPAETAHRLVVGLLRWLQALPFVLCLLRRALTPRDPALEVRALGLRFPTPVGLAAGFDKDAEAYQALSALGFGFVEVGTITAQPQPGNPRPRLFRLPADRALVNRMGFNNQGAKAAAARLAAAARSAPLGVNIGKTKVVPNEQAVSDYVASARLLAAHADYLVINVSSPNTPELRKLQAVEALEPLLVSVRGAIDDARPGSRLPLLLKIAPDLTDDEIDAIAALALRLGIDGIIATNTTIERGGLHSTQAQVEAAGDGGLSGAPLKARALAVLGRLRAAVGDRVVLIAAGGIESADDAWERIVAGASLVQVYTAFVYQGPLFPSRLARALARKARAAGVSRVSEAVGNANLSRA